ncbi:MAG: acyl-ACP desaturase [Nitriliruptorales bacterium]|nr:acyl-ACP desaturase [Nitriliruptorales bacterium]
MAAPAPTDRDLLHELEPEAERLLERHLSVADEWFPHEYVPWGEARDFEEEPWTPDQPRLSGVARTAFFVNLMTEDNLPSYHREIHAMFGGGDSAWRTWIHRWTAEEGRHSIVLRDYLVTTRNEDPVKLERGRMQMVSDGYEHHDREALHGFVYVSFQELATRISHRNTGKYSEDPVADRIMARVAADENLHMVFYRDIVSAAIELDPSAAVQAIADEVIGFEMPGAGLSGFRMMSARIADAAIYDPRNHHDDVLWPLLRNWGVFELEGLDAEAEQRRDELAAFLDDLDETASRFEEKRAERHARRAARV